MFPAGSIAYFNTSSSRSRCLRIRAALGGFQYVSLDSWIRFEEETDDLDPGANLCNFRRLLKDEHLMADLPEGWQRSGISLSP